MTGKQFYAHVSQSAGKTIQAFSRASLEVLIEQEMRHVFASFPIAITIDATLDANGEYTLPTAEKMKVTEVFYSGVKLDRTSAPWDLERMS